MKNYKIFIFDILKAYSAILFLNNKIAGFLILAITIINPTVGLSGIIAVVSTIVFSKIIEIKDEYLHKGFYIYNSLLIGMGVGYMFNISLLSIFLISGLASFTFMLSFMLNRIFSNYKIPILSLPFSIVAMFLYLASMRYASLYETLVNHQGMYDIQLPIIISSFLKSLGTIFFLPNNIIGILFLLVILYFSRIVFIMSLTGFYFGIFTHSILIGSFEKALYDPYAFNYILVAIALCGVFLLPTIRNFILSLLGVFISVILTDSFSIIFSTYGIPVFTLPFNITVISFIFILSIMYYKEFNYDIKETPEKSLSNYLSTIFRFGAIYNKISLPFSGKWTVYQGFDDLWTHKGKYKYAYDFVKKKDDKTYANDGLELSDYYCFGESILSPVDGYIVACRHDLIDNYIGGVDKINNWGNYIIIRSNLGFYVEISHIMQYSIAYKIGDYVSTNDILAKCGNSGYSPEPHIHIQVQETGFLGAITQNFCFTAYYSENELIFNNIPKKDEEISSVIINKSIQSKLLFILDDSFNYNVFKGKEVIESVEFIVKMSEFGEFYLEDKSKNRLYFHNDFMQFYFYQYRGDDSYLKKLFILAPRLPFISQNGVEYSDFLPVNLVKSRLNATIIELLSTIKKDFYKMKRKYIYVNYTIISENGEVSLESSNKGFKTISYDDITLKRIE